MEKSNILPLKFVVSGPLYQEYLLFSKALRNQHCMELTTVTSCSAILSLYTIKWSRFSGVALGGIFELTIESSFFRTDYISTRNVSSTPNCCSGLSIISKMLFRKLIKSKHNFKPKTRKTGKQISKWRKNKAYFQMTGAWEVLQEGFE